MRGDVVRRDEASLIVSRRVIIAGIALGEHSYVSIAIKRFIRRLINRDYEVER